MALPNRARGTLAGLPYFDTRGPLAFAHRGFSPDGLENSRSAFQAAVDLGYPYVETDARATRDGVVLAFHDATLDRVTDRSGTIAELLWSEVSSARIAGREPVAKLEDILAEWPHLRLNIDVKDAATVGPLARLIDRAGAHDRVCVASFSDRRRRAVQRRVRARIVTSAGRSVTTAFRLASAIPGGGPVARWVLRDVECLQVPERFGPIPVVTAKMIASAHAAGKQVHVWTVNSADDMNRLLDLGVDGIITDRADTLREVLMSRGQWFDPRAV